MIEGGGLSGALPAQLFAGLQPDRVGLRKLKQHLRGAAERTFAGLVAATGPALDAVTAADARGFFAHCGYHLSGQLL